MNKDIRLSTTFFQNIKTIRLREELGPRGVLSILQLWCYAAIHKPDGYLTNMNDKDIARAAGWNGKPEKFIQTLINPEAPWLEKDEKKKCYRLHGWKEHNTYAAHAKERSEASRKAAEKRWKRGIENHIRRPKNTETVSKNTKNSREEIENYDEKSNSKREKSHLKNDEKKAVLETENAKNKGNFQIVSDEPHTNPEISHKKSHSNREKLHPSRMKTSEYSHPEDENNPKKNEKKRTQEEKKTNHIRDEKVEPHPNKTTHDFSRYLFPKETETAYQNMIINPDFDEDNVFYQIIKLLEKHKNTSALLRILSLISLSPTPLPISAITDIGKQVFSESTE